MSYGLYCIRHLPSRKFEPCVHCFATDYEAFRFFEQERNNPGKVYFHSPGEYEIFCIGGFSSDQGFVYDCVPYPVDLSDTPYFEVKDLNSFTKKEDV